MDIMRVEYPENCWSCRYYKEYYEYGGALESNECELTGNQYFHSDHECKLVDVNGFFTQEGAREFRERGFPEEYIEKLLNGL